MHHNCFKKIIYPNEAYIQRYVNLKNHILFITLDIYMDTHTHTHTYIPFAKSWICIKNEKNPYFDIKIHNHFLPQKGAYNRE
jgi:hypothetical protein